MRLPGILPFRDSQSRFHLRNTHNIGNQRDNLPFLLPAADRPVQGDDPVPGPDLYIRSFSLFAGKQNRIAGSLLFLQFPASIRPRSSGSPAWTAPHRSYRVCAVPSINMPGKRCGQGGALLRRRPLTMQCLPVRPDRTSPVRPERAGRFLRIGPSVSLSSPGFDLFPIFVEPGKNVFADLSHAHSVPGRGFFAIGRKN